MATASPSLDGLRGCDDAEALARIAAVDEALGYTPTPEPLLASLPRSLDGFSSEVVLALAELWLRLARHRPPLPAGREALEARLAIAWIRVELACEPTPQRLAQLDDRELLLALAEPQTCTSALLERLVGSQDPRLRSLAIEQIERAIAELVFAPERGCELLFELCADAQVRIRQAAFEALGHGALSTLPERLAADRQQRLAAGLADPELVSVCANLAVQWDQRELLVTAAFEGASADLRDAALAELGALAHDDDLTAALRMASEDPLRFDSNLRVFLLAAHRRGVFLREHHLPALLDAFDRHHGWTAIELVRVTHIVRHPLVTLLGSLPADDPRWLRRAAILASSIDAAAPELLASLLRACTDVRIAAALIDAAARSVAFDDELALLAWLARVPEPVITALRFKGREHAAAQLRERVADPCYPADLRELALPSLWALTDDRPALLRELAELLGPRAGGLLQSKHLSNRDATAAMIVRERLGQWDAELEPLEALRLLCEAGKLELLPDVTRLFRQIVGEYVGEALAGDFTIKRQRMPELEQLLYRYGRHLLADGRCVRRWLDDTAEAPDDLLLGIVVAWLREDPPVAIAVALLETLTRKQIRGAWLRQIEHLWRHRELEVRRAALETINAGHDDARGLELSIAGLATHDNERLARQAVLGIAALRARWAEPLVIAALSRPQMLLKREAATTLAQIGSSRCVPALLEWLARHDNAGFRADLLTALDAVAREHTGALIVAAMREHTDARARELLRNALHRRLNLAAALRLAASEHPADRELIDAMLARAVELSDASAEQLATALRRAKLRDTPEPADDPGRRLRIEGFSPAAALELLERCDGTFEPSVGTLVRSELAAWITWLRGPQAPTGAQRIAAIECLLEHAQARQPHHDDALLELAATPGLHPRVVVGFIERQATVKRGVAWLARARALLRGLPSVPEVSGPRRYSLLGTLAALRSREDLDRCLRDCAIGPNYPGDSARLLTTVLALPNPARDEPEAITRLREQVTNYYRLSTDEAARWLDEQLRERPLELRAPADWPHAKAAPARKPHSRAEYDALMQLVIDDGPDRQARERAAERLLAWPDALELPDCHTRLLERYLSGAIDLGPAAIATLAARLEHWPTAPGPRALPLLRALGPHQRRAFLPGWIRAWERGEPDADAWLRALDQEQLIPIARSRAEAGDTTLLRLLGPSRSPAMRELVTFVASRAPGEVAHLVPREAAARAHPLSDPLAETSFDELVELIEDRRTEVGLAVRALHRLTTHERAADAIARLCVDRRPRIRSAALRALRKLDSRERHLAAVVEVLSIETRKDVIASLLATLAHNRHEPGLAAIIERLWSSDTKLVDAAEQALLAWGPEVLPSLTRLARKARPDRRAQLETIIERLERARED